jgi:hypothetical protein
VAETWCGMIDVMMTEFESPTKSNISLAETDEEETFTSKKSSTKAKSTATNTNNRVRPATAAPKRPPAKPLTGGTASSTTAAARMNSGSGVGGFMTQAERGKIDAKEKKAAEQDCFEFLRNLKDVRVGSCIERASLVVLSRFRSFRTLMVFWFAVSFRKMDISQVSDWL